MLSHDVLSTDESAIDVSSVTFAEPSIETDPDTNPDNVIVLAVVHFNADVAAPPGDEDPA